MAKVPWSLALHRAAGAALRQGGGPADGELLGRFVRCRDGSAFAELVRRHGPMVLGVCRRLLRHEYDAEDAFQATFLVLARKAGSVRPPGRVGPWLYGVARHTALAARRASACRRAHEAAAAEVAAVRAVVPASAAEGGLGEVLEMELARLPERYRAAVVLCGLEGRPYRQAAALLGWPEGTVASRLARARALLAERLARRGVLLPAGGLAAALAPGAVPAPLSAAAVGAALFYGPGAAGAVAPPVAGLAEAVLRGMLMAKLKTITIAAAAVLGLAGAGAGLFPAAAAVVPGGTATAAAVAPQDDDPPRAGQARTESEEVRRLREEVRRLKAELDARQARLDEALERLARLTDGATPRAPYQELYRRGAAPTPPRPGAAPPPIVPPAVPPADAAPGPIQATPPLPRQPAQPAGDRVGGCDPYAPPVTADVQGRLERLERGMDALLKEMESLRPRPAGRDLVPPPPAPSPGPGQ
jgi:RNA polymerase sigma factor (sigma-70 family)